MRLSWRIGCAQELRLAVGRSISCYCMNRGHRRFQLFDGRYASLGYDSWLTRLRGYVTQLCMKFIQLNLAVLRVLPERLVNLEHWVSIRYACCRSGHFIIEKAVFGTTTGPIPVIHMLFAISRSLIQ